MSTVKADPAVLGKLAGLLRPEAPEAPEACIRLKEYTRGGDRHVTKMPGTGIDVRDGSRDLPCVVGEVPFIAAEGLCRRYGGSFALLLGKGRLHVECC